MALVVVVKDSSYTVVEVTCTTAGRANVAIAVADMPGQITRLSMFFTDGSCPRAVDADAAVDADVDAGAESDGG